MSRIAAACACHCALILLALSLWFAALYGAVDPPPMTSSTALRACSTQNGLPVTVTAHGTEDWSIWIRAPVCACKPFTVSPPRDAADGFAGSFAAAAAEGAELSLIHI